MLAAVGGTVSEVRQDADGAYWYRMGISHTPAFQDSVRRFVKDANKHREGGGVTVGFPNPYRIRIGPGSPARRTR